jgi:Glycosyl hydrolases family 43/F5/8 type C domain
MSKNTPLLLSLFLLLITTGLKAQQKWYTPNVGNIIVPGYFADPSILYDEKRDSFYVYATTDGVWIAYSREPHVAVSKDLVNWEFRPVTFPDYYPICTPQKPNSQNAGVWAPTVFKHPVNGKYYLGYQINVSFYVLVSDSPTGPWKNATSGTTAETAALLKDKEQWGSGDGFDCQFFVDKDNSVYIAFGGGGRLGVCKAKFDEQGLISIDNSDPRFTDGEIAKHIRIKLPEYLEGPVLFRDDNTYYLTYSCDAAQNYKVRYATAPTPAGPFTPQEGYIVKRSDSQEILGTGHNDILNYKGDFYILYHRQHFPMVDVKRQTCIDRIKIKDGKISLEVQSQDGLNADKGKLGERYRAAKAKEPIPVSFGKKAIASSVSDYKGGTMLYEKTEAIPSFYKADFVLDNNFNTRWQSADTVGAPAWIIVDLEKETAVTNTEIMFEYVLRQHGYTIEYLSGKNATSLEKASLSKKWKLYANGFKSTPAKDAKKVKARFVKLSIKNVNLPKGEDYNGAIKQDYENHPSVVEFKIFGK